MKKKATDTIFFLILFFAYRVPIRLQRTVKVPYTISYLSVGAVGVSRHARALPVPHWAICLLRRCAEKCLEMLACVRPQPLGGVATCGGNVHERLFVGGGQQRPAVRRRGGEDEHEPVGALWHPAGIVRVDDIHGAAASIGHAR